jgi:hypothetical protein
MRASVVPLLLVTALVWLVPRPAQAIFLSEEGQTAYLSGPIEPGDAAVFAAFLSRPRPTKITVLYLSSFGGSLEAGLAIGRMVRRAGLTTAVNADQTECDSACTFIFAGGVRRHYVNGDKVFAGFTGMSGLGYHPVTRRGNRTTPNMKAFDATDLARRFFIEMGQPGAAALADRAGINSVYRPSGAMALQLHIATSLASPSADPRYSSFGGR